LTHHLHPHLDDDIRSGDGPYSCPRIPEDDPPNGAIYLSGVFEMIICSYPSHAVVHTVNFPFHRSITKTVNWKSPRSLSVGKTCSTDWIWPSLWSSGQWSC